MSENFDVRRGNVPEAQTEQPVPGGSAAPEGASVADAEYESGLLFQLIPNRKAEFKPLGGLRPDELKWLATKMASQAVVSQASTYSTPIRIWIDVGNCQVERRLRHTTVMPLEQLREDIEFHLAGFLGVKEFCGVTLACRHDLMEATKITIELLDEHGDGPSVRHVSMGDMYFNAGPDAQNRRDNQIEARLDLHVLRVKEVLQTNKNVVDVLSNLLSNQWRLTEEEIAQFFLNNPIV